MKKWLFVPFMLACMPFLKAEDAVWRDFKRETLVYQDPKVIEGWCSKEKAEKMMDLIFDARPRVCVEVGVHQGSSIYPTASALKFNGFGVVYAIDPWDRNASLVGYTFDDPDDVINRKFWGDFVDYNESLKSFKIKCLNRFDLNNFCIIMRMRSTDAVSKFEDESIDIVHIDGNHTDEMSLTDVQIWLPKVKKGGYIWFDDFNWSSTKRAGLFLKENCDHIVERSVGDSCALFRKR